MRMSILATIFAAVAATASGYQQMYDRTSPGTIEVKKIPELKSLQATGTGEYFKTDDSVFMKLFRYIDANNVTMTVPVESDVKSNRMRFFIGDDDKTRTLTNTETVVTLTQPERQVASIGIRGSYTQEHYDEGLKKLQTWLDDHRTEWAVTGEPCAVFWNSPFVPGFIKKSEIHIPVRSLKNEGQ